MITKKKDKIIIEGNPQYENEGNGYLRQWALLKYGKGIDDTIDLFKIFTRLLGDSGWAGDKWKAKKVRLTVEVIKEENKKKE